MKVQEALNVVEQALLNAIAVMENKTELTTTQRESRKAAAITQCKNALMALECKSALADIEKCEQVGYLIASQDGVRVFFDSPVSFKNHTITPVYTSPISKEWVTLTYGQAYKCISDNATTSQLDLVRDVEAKLKELNT